MATDGSTWAPLRIGAFRGLFIAALKSPPNSFFTIHAISFSRSAHNSGSITLNRITFASLDGGAARISSGLSPIFLFKASNPLVHFASDAGYPQFVHTIIS